MDEQDVERLLGPVARASYAHRENRARYRAAWTIVLLLLVASVIGYAEEDHKDLWANIIGGLTAGVAVALFQTAAERKSQAMDDLVHRLDALWISARQRAPATSDFGTDASDPEASGGPPTN